MIHKYSLITKIVESDLSSMNHNLSAVCSQHTLLLFFLWVVSPYAVVKAGGKAQPGQVGCQQQRCCAVDGIPRQHGGSNSPSENNDLNKCLNRETKEVKLSYLLHLLLSFPLPSQLNEIITCMCLTYQFQLVCTKENRSPGPVQSELQPIQSQRHHCILSETSKLFPHQVGAVSAWQDLK